MPVAVIIGTRTPERLDFEFAKLLSAHLVDAGWIVRTGGAAGIDTAAIKGGNEIDPHRVWIYEPWEGFADPVADVENQRIPLQREWFDSIERYHPTPWRLSKTARRLHARNYGMIVYPTTADLVIACPGKAGGGTWQGIRIAQALSIPLRLIHTPQGRKALVERLEKGAARDGRSNSYLIRMRQIVEAEGYPRGYPSLTNLE